MQKVTNKEQDKIDWIKAAILVRKMDLKLEWADIAYKAKCNPDTLRKLVSQKHTDNWPADIRRNVCRALGISIRMVLSVVHDEEVELL